MGNRNKFKPPRLFEAILDWYCSDIFLEDLKGDLYEYFNRRSQKYGRNFAQLMFLVDVLRNFKPYLFGRHEIIKVNGMDIFFNNLKSIRRNLIRHKLYATINIVGLALGISGGLFIWQYVSHELRYEDFHVNKAQVYRITPEYTGEGGFHVHWARTPMSWVDDLVTELPEVKKQIRFQNYYPRIVKIGERSFKEKHGFAVDSGVFEVFSFELLSGEPEIALKEPFSVVLTQSISHKYFGNENPMGQIIQILNEADSSLENYKVTGVMKDLPTNTHLPVNFLTSFRNIEERTGWAYNYIQLIDDTDVNNVRAKLPALIEKYRDPDDLGQSVLHLQPISDIHLYSSLAREIIPNGDIFYVKIFGSAGIFILLMAMINFTNLSTSKALERTREIGVRKVLGSNRRALFGYFMTEAMLYSFIASIVSLILVGIFSPYFKEVSGITMALNGHLLIVLLVIAILVGFVSGLYPAVTISRFQPIMALKGFSNNIWGEHKFSLRKILIAVQFVIALIILSSTIITKRQFDFLQQKNLGFETDQILAITNSPWDVQDEYKNFRYEIEKIPGVAGVTANMEVPSREIRDTGAIRFEDFHEENDEIIMDIQIADSNYIEFMGMRLLAGRNFSTDLGSGEFPPDGSPNEAYYEYANSARREYIINETALGLLGISDARDALGKKFGWGNGILKLQDGPIVGVVEDSHQETLRNKVDPLAVVYEPMFLRTFLIKLESENIQESLSGIDNVWKQMFPSYPMESAFLDDLFGQLYRSEQRQKETLSIFSSVIIIIALLGLLGLLSFMIQRRMKELAIRKILGASKISLLYLFGKNFVVQALIALCIAAPVTVYFMRGWLENFAYRTSITGMEFFLSFIALLSVLGITLLVQVGKSANLNPVETLRCE